MLLPKIKIRVDPPISQGLKLYLLAWREKTELRNTIQAQAVAEHVIHGEARQTFPLKESFISGHIVLAMRAPTPCLFLLFAFPLA